VDCEVNLCRSPLGHDLLQSNVVAEPIPIRALVMDSSVDTLDLLRQYLEFRGFEVETCDLARLRHDGADAAATIARARPDVVVFDIALPYEENWKLCASLRQDPRVSVPFVLTTTNRGAVERLTGARDVIEILGKPYDLEQFAEAVHSAVRASDDTQTAGEPRGDTRRGVDRRIGERRREDRRRGPASK
jgi:DNA-binding response OmpR family regulator